MPLLSESERMGHMLLTSPSGQALRRLRRELEQEQDNGWYLFRRLEEERFNHFYSAMEAIGILQANVEKNERLPEVMRESIRHVLSQPGLAELAATTIELGQFVEAIFDPSAKFPDKFSGNDFETCIAAMRHELLRSRASVEWRKVADAVVESGAPQAYEEGLRTANLNPIGRRAYDLAIKIGREKNVLRRGFLAYKRLHDAIKCSQQTVFEVVRAEGLRQIDSSNHLTWCMTNACPWGAEIETTLVGVGFMLRLGEIVKITLPGSDSATFASLLSMTLHFGRDIGGFANATFLDLSLDGPSVRSLAEH